jgi:aminoglycoside phosphotransferase (APT) family kinase protein
MPRMHPDEIDIDEGLIRRLLRSQFADWSDLPIARVASPGTDHAIFRLGTSLSVRLARIHWAAGKGEKEAAWMPRIATHLPVAIPVPFAVGEAGDGYPWRWTIAPWLPGDDAFTRRPDLDDLASDLAAFVNALHGVDAADGPPPDAPRAGRGIPLPDREDEVRDALRRLSGVIDTDLAVRAWEEVRDAPGWQGRPIWIHGDLQATNLLVEDGRLTAVIDFGGLGVGDPAADLIPAWSIFEGSSREAFRKAVAADDATWARGAGWALSVGLVALPYYLDTNPVIVEWSRRSIDAVLADVVG